MNTFTLKVYLRLWEQQHTIPWRLSQTLLLKKLKEAPLALYIMHSLGRVLLSSPVASLFLQSPKDKHWGWNWRCEAPYSAREQFSVIIKAFIWDWEMLGADWLLLCCLPSGEGLAIENSVHAVGLRELRQCLFSQCISFSLILVWSQEEEEVTERYWSLKHVVQRKSWC